MDLNLNDDLNVEIDEYDTDYKNNSESTIFLVQVCEKLFEKIDDSENSDTFYNMIVKSYEKYLKSKIISKPDDFISLIFYDTSKSDNYLRFDNIYEFQNISNLTADIINKVEDLYINFPKIGKKSNFFDVIWLCSTLFRVKLPKKNFTKNIFLFTQDENPFHLDKNYNEKLKKLMNEINESELEIELFPIINEKDNFDFSKFYHQFIKIDNNDEANIQKIMKQKFKNLYNRIIKKQFSKRNISKGEFFLGKDCEIGIKIYSLFVKSTIPTANFLNIENNRKIKKVIKYKCLETDESITADKLGNFWEIGQEKIVFEDEELKKIKNIEKPKLTLLGFKPIDRIKPYYNMKNSHFIYPDDRKITNSSKAFDGLIKEMLDLEKVAICKYSTNRSNKINIVALFPQLENSNNNKLLNSGFNMIFLPFKNDIRDLNSFKSFNTYNTLPKKEDVNIANNLIEKMTRSFDITKFENQSLQTFFNYLQTLALKKNNINDDDKKYLTIIKKNEYENFSEDIDNFVDYFQKKMNMNINNSDSEEEYKPVKNIKIQRKKKK